MRDEPPAIVGIAPGPPFDRVTWSGISFHLFGALKRQGALAGAVDGNLPTSLDVLAKALAVNRRRRRWIEQYEFSGFARAGRSRLGARRAARVDPRPDALLQIGAWYDFASQSLPQPRLRASYHDSNLALALRHSSFVEDPGARHVRRTMAAEHVVYDGLDVLFTMSEWLRGSFIQDFGQAPEKVVAVGAGANLLSYPEAVPERDFDRPRFLFVGFDFERKGGEDLLRAFGFVHAAAPDAELWIVGPPPRDDRDGVRWLGPIRRNTPGGDAELGRLYGEATAFVMPSRFEPFGVAFVEAMANGLPCVGADVCAMPEIIVDGETGRVVPPSEPEALGQAMLEICEPATARAMGLAGRARFLERFTWDRVAERMVERLRGSLA